MPRNTIMQMKRLVPLLPQSLLLIFDLVFMAEAF